MPTFCAGEHGEQQICAVGPTPRANLTLVLLDEPSMGLAPQIVKEVLHLVNNLHTSGEFTVLGAEQNTHMALQCADYGYIREGGRVVLNGVASELVSNEDIKDI